MAVQMQIQVQGRRIGVLAAQFLLTTSLLACTGEPPSIEYISDARASTYHFVNGNWFDGEGFVPRAFYVVDGMLTSQEPATIDAVVDLRAGFVVPPFGEAHQHNVDADNGMLEELNASYLKAGVFYVKNPNTLPRTLPATLAIVERPTTIDAVFSGGGVTVTDGHPKGVAQRNVDRGYWTTADVDGGFIYEIDDAAELEARWREIATASRDFVKTYLLYSEEYAERADSADAQYWKGLDPELLPRLVELAHRDDLRVATHVESAADFRAAVNAGVDEINHTPGFRRGGPEPDQGYAQACTLSRADADLAAAAGTTVVTTSSGWLLRGVVKRNLEHLRDAGVTIVVGTDSYEAAPTEEIEWLQGSGIFSNAQLLTMWAVDTPRSIFPDRAIARLADSFEASFIVLDGNPLEDFDYVRDIRLGVKQGRIILRRVEPDSPI